MANKFDTQYEEFGKNGYQGASLVEYDPTTYGALKPCPFCSEEKLINFKDSDNESGLYVSNTHTPSYTVACSFCDAEMHGASFGDKLKEGMSYDEGIALHERAIHSAVTKWNIRVGG